MKVLAAIAGAMSSTIFGIPVAVAIIAGIAAIAAALALSGAIEFAKGGVVTGPTTALIGEAGHSEAVIPLNDRGAKFMQETMGGGAGGVLHLHIYQDGLKTAEQVVKHMHNVIHTKLGYT